MKKKKILILQNVILHYRKALYNKLAEVHDITVLHSGPVSKNESDSYQEIIVKKFKLGPLYFQSGIIKESKSKAYDVIIAMLDLRWINNIIALYMHHKNTKYIWWGAWFTQNKFANKTRLILTKKADANIFYTEEARQKFIEAGISKQNLFVANNTFDVGKRNKCYKNQVKNIVLFVGSLNHRKQNDILITAFYNIKNKISEDIKLVIAGEGVEKEFLVNLVFELKLENRVIFLGSIIDNSLLLNLYKNAIVSVSFGQAGLSVLQSFGYGVPFITKINAISGGEKSNIIDGYNGLLSKDNITSLEECLEKMLKNVENARLMGKNAYYYYNNFCTIENMVENFTKAIKYNKI